MVTMNNGCNFQPSGFGILRASSFPRQSIEHLSAISRRESVEVGDDVLRAIINNRALREAISVSSHSLSMMLEKFDSGVPISAKRMRRSVQSVVRYMLRIQHRATPFGMMSGVAPITFHDDIRVKIGADHRKHVRPDIDWLTSVIRPWERDLEVLKGLHILANNLCYVRGDRLVVPVSGSKKSPSAENEHTVRYTNAVRIVMESAKHPKTYEILARDLSVAFPEASQGTIDGLIVALVDQECLLTDLHPPAYTTDPLEHVLSKMAHLNQHSGREELQRIKELLYRYEKSEFGQGYEHHVEVSRAIQRLRPADRPLAVDLKLDAECVLPHSVASDIAEATSLAWRLLPPRAGRSHPLASYQTRFMERFGVGIPIPVKQVIDPNLGLGSPYTASELERNHSHEERSMAGRDHFLSSLAQRSAAEGRREVVLDGVLVKQLAQYAGDGPPPPYTEAAFRLLAGSVEDLESGSYRLAPSTAQLNVVGSMFGRFMNFIPEHRTEILSVAEQVSTGSNGTTPVQLSSYMTPRARNIAQIPTLIQKSIAVGTFPDGERSTTLSLDDIAIVSKFDFLSVVDTRTGEEITPLLFHAVNPEHLPHIVRLLQDIGTQKSSSWALWDWGGAAQLPFLPRICYRRTVLSHARWLPSPRLSNSTASWDDWRQEFDRWKSEWLVPDDVYAARAGGHIRLNLSNPLDLRIFRDEFRKFPELALVEEPCDEAGDGWSETHAAEIVVPLQNRSESVSAKPIAREMNRKVRFAEEGVRDAYTPGGEWLYLKIYGLPAWQDEVLVRYLSPLLGKVASFIDKWHFIRYRDDRPHLRIRFHGKPTVVGGFLLPEIHMWASKLLDTAVISDVTIETYRPETERYGGKAILPLAELAFDADSRSVLEQLELRSRGRLPDFPVEMIVAANCMDLARRLNPLNWRAWMLSEYPKSAHHSVFQKCRRQAVGLLDPSNDWASLSSTTGGPELLSVWQRRAPILEQYGQKLRRLVEGGELSSADASYAVASILHMHHNRFAGINLDSERGSYAIARGVIQSAMDRERNSLHGE